MFASTFARVQGPWVVLVAGSISGNDQLSSVSFLPSAVLNIASMGLNGHRPLGIGWSWARKLLHSGWTWGGGLTLLPEVIRAALAWDISPGSQLDLASCQGKSVIWCTEGQVVHRVHLPYIQLKALLGHWWWSIGDGCHSTSSLVSLEGKNTKWQRKTLGVRRTYRS